MAKRGMLRWRQEPRLTRMCYLQSYYPHITEDAEKVGKMQSRTAKVSEGLEKAPNGERDI